MHPILFRSVSEKNFAVSGFFYCGLYIELLCIELLIILFGGMALSINKDLVAASAGPLVLSILAQGENYGYAIIKRVEELSGGQMKWSDGMLYPVLHRLEKQGLIESEERTSESGRKRRYYLLKKEGTEALAKHRTQWLTVYSTLKRLWENEPCLT